MSGAPAPSIELGDPAPRPERSRPRLFALPAESPDTIALQAGLEEKLIAARLYKPEKRPFWPHVTVARGRREERGSDRPARLSKLPGTPPEGLLQPFDGIPFTLFRSPPPPPGAQDPPP